MSGVWANPGIQIGTRERHIESLLQSTLRQVILVNNFPRTLIQITLQVTVAPENEYINAKVAQASTVCSRRTERRVRLLLGSITMLTVHCYLPVESAHYTSPDPDFDTGASLCCYPFDSHPDVRGACCCQR